MLRCQPTNLTETPAMSFLPPTVAPIVLLIGSNIFMTTAWYWHLRFKETPLVGVILAVLPFEVLRSYSVASRRVRLLLVARLVQEAAFLLPLAPFWWNGAQEVERVAWALSASCAAAFLALAVLVLRRRG